MQNDIRLFRLRGHDGLYCTLLGPQHKPILLQLLKPLKRTTIICLPSVLRFARELSSLISSRTCLIDCYVSSSHDGSGSPISHILPPIQPENILSDISRPHPPTMMSHFVTILYPEILITLLHQRPFTLIHVHSLNVPKSILRLPLQRAL